MRKMRMFLILTTVIVSVPALSPLAALGQDAPSLGDAARQARLQKQQREAQAKDAARKDASGKDANGNGKDAQPAARVKKISKVITNEEIPERLSPAARPSVSGDAAQALSNSPGSGAPSEAKGEALKSQIASMKSSLAALQSQIDSLNDSIHFASGNCVANCVQWNERQLQKQEQMEQVKEQLEAQKKQLEEVQEAARQQGFGSSVYDP